MEKLFDFFKKYFIVFIFLCLEIVACSLFFFSKGKQRALFYNISNKITAAFSSSYNNFVNIKDLKNINDSILEENALLKNQIEKYRTNNIPVLKHIEYQYIAAQICGCKIGTKNNELKINKGLKNNIKENMGVISKNGIVGIINTCSNNYAEIIPIINKNFNLNVKLQNSNYYGSLQWDGKNVRKAQVTDIPTYVKLEIGDTIVTSNLSQIFPENINVGTICKINKDLTSDFYLLTIELATDFNNLAYVYVIIKNNNEE